MPFILRPFALTQRASLILCWYAPNGLLVAGRAHRDLKQSLTGHQQHDEETEDSTATIDEGDVYTQHDHYPPFPLVSEQIDDRVEDFIASIDKGAVCLLASQHNGQKPCSITKQMNGSFNVCFFALFDDGTMWVVRIPLEPVVQDSWIKVQSEVATMRFIKSKTTIPIPRVYGYGQSTQLTKNGSLTTFMICDFVPGQSLRFDDINNATTETRTQFLGELVDILLQLRRLEFPAAGSLMPNLVDDSEPIVGGFLGMAINELQRDTGKKENLISFSSAKAFMDHQYSILSEYYAVPLASLQRASIEEQLFVLNSLAEEIPKLLESQWSNGPFVLSHLDLRCSNIVVDEDLHILGIIDWEFSGTVPLQYFTPPLWITGEGRSGAFLSFQDAIFHDFEAVLQAKSATSEGCAQLMREWDWGNKRKLMFPIVQILREPDTLVRVYRRHLCQRFYGGSLSLKEVVSDFFAHHETAKKLEPVLRHRLEGSKRYTEYLIHHDLLDTDEDEERRAAERLALLKKGVVKFGAGKPTNATN
ncbi:hypothetical protein CEP51_015358 [Fusarium floridanum]|uniref:Aminoglycoside phosphotransferase domain-containing protein n=1 Tax=Fusarium floridanum TaxID=1325733 RepID=A0A428PBM5_9HYPO|nr:hypothetical protein CEP51_015358 [Fusarium floridanum]